MANLDLIITDGKIELVGLLSVPDGCLGLVLFAHGSGSSRYSPRNVSVARILNQAGIGTLLFDLLTPEEAELTGTGRSKVFNIPFLASRLQMATHWVNSKEELKKLNIAYLGASTGAAAALLAAANLGDQIVAVISRGGASRFGYVVSGSSERRGCFNRRFRRRLGARTKSIGASAPEARTS